MFVWGGLFVVDDIMCLLRKLLVRLGGDSLLLMVLDVFRGNSRLSTAPGVSGETCFEGAKGSACLEMIASNGQLVWK